MPVVLWWHEELRDGHEYGAKVLDTVPQALALAQSIKDSFFGPGTEIRLYELGPEIPLRFRVDEQPQPPKTTTVVELGQQNGVAG